MEAAYCLQLDFDEGKTATVAGYSKQWGWSRDKVRKFLKNLGAEIVYPEKTTIKQNQKGFLKKTDKKTDNRQIKKQIRFIDIKNLQNKKNRPKNRKPTDQPATTIEPIDEPKYKYSFVENSIEFQLAKFLIEKIFENYPNHKKPNLQEWARHIDYMIRLDNRNPDEIRIIIAWAQKDPFWQPRIDSTSGLRRNYDQLVMQMRPINSDRPNYEAMP